jgi:hypothetical protein
MVAGGLPLRLLRRGLRRAAAQSRFPRVPMQHMPVLFGNSFPKSGTHLLTQILAGFAQLGPVVESGLPPVLTYAGESGEPRPLASILADLARLLPGDIAYGHLHALPKISAALTAPGVAPYFIYRDPRDVVVSHVFYVTDINNAHVHHDFYAKQLTTFERRLEVSILGRPELANPFPNIRARFEPFLAWIQRPEVLALRYEDLLTETESWLGRILDHAAARGFIYSGTRAEAIATLHSAIDPQRSPTFRSGKSGGWLQHFTPEHKNLFKEVSGDLLIQLGYEKNQNW